MCKVCKMFVYKHTEIIELVKSSLLFKKNINFKGEHLKNLKDKDKIFWVLLLHKLKHIERFSNLR